jgi:hypothetical protein
MTTNDAAAASGTEAPAEPPSAAEFFGEDDTDAGEAEKPAEPAAEAAPGEVDDEEAPAEGTKLTPAQAALAKKETALRAEQKEHLAAAEQLKKDRAEFEASKGSADALRKAARTDLAGFIAELKLDPETALEQVKAAWWSLQPEDKRPADFRKGAKTRTELDEIKEKADKAARDLAEYKKSVEEKEKARETEAKLDQFFSASRDEFAKLALPHTNALAKARPAKLNKEIEIAFLALEDEGVEITPDKLGARVEQALSERYGYLRDVFAPKTETTQEPKDKKAPTTALSAKKVAGGGPMKTTAVETEAERNRRALRELGVED